MLVAAESLAQKNEEKKELPRVNSRQFDNTLIDDTNITGLSKKEADEHIAIVQRQKPGRLDVRARRPEGQDGRRVGSA